ncbi:hypothetical protein ACWD4O_02380 [Streptomyces sp. NPDC002623]
MIANARSFKQRQVPRSEVLAAVGRFRDSHKIKHVTVGLDEIEDYEADVWLADGDLHVHGDLDLHQERAYLLVVLGDLVVDGGYADYDDPESYLLVTGDMRARDVVTAGWLEVHGELRADRLIGDYNDCAAYIGGDVHTGLFYGEEHHFTVGGALTAAAVIGRPRLEIAQQPVGLEMDDPRLLEHLDRDLLRVYDDEDEDGRRVTCVDGIRDFREVKRRVKAGRPLHSPD